MNSLYTEIKQCFDLNITTFVKTCGAKWPKMSSNLSKCNQYHSKIAQNLISGSFSRKTFITGSKEVIPRGHKLLKHYFHMHNNREFLRASPKYRHEHVYQSLKYGDKLY